jgi:hypothetical protein
MTVEELLQEATRLSRDEQLRLVQELMTLVNRRTENLVPATALLGVGRSLWDGTDAQAYVRRERESWGG